MNVPRVFLDGAQVERVVMFKCLGHAQTENLVDDDDIGRERRALVARCNMLACRIMRCSSDV